MHDYLLSTEVVRLAFVLGVAVSMLLYERRHLTTGSIVVPGYIAVFIVYPLIIVATFVNALLSYFIVNKVLRRWFLLYGRTKFTVMALVSIVIQTAMLKLTPSGPWLWESDLKLFVGVGYVVPALIAHDMGRQGIARTTKSVLMAAAIVAIPIALALLFDLPGVNDLSPLQGVGDMAIDAAWVPVAVFLSAAASWGVAHNHGFRSGGFVGAAFIGMLLGDPWQVVIAVAIAAVTYVFVTRVLMKSMILFGRRKFSAMLLVSSSLSWCLLWMGKELFDSSMQQHLDLGSLALTPLFIPGLLANDTQRTGPRHVLFGVALAGSFVLATTWWVQSLFEDLPLHIGWKVLSVASFAAIFWRQFVPTREAKRAQLGTSAVANPAPVVVAGFGQAGFERWAAMHRDAADAADHWLATLLGEPEAPPSSEIGAPAPVEAAPERLTVRARRAAMQVRSNESTAAGLPVRKRPARQGGGEFDAISTGIAATVGRPKQLPRRQRGVALGLTTRPRVAPEAAPAPRVQLGSLPRHDQISESPGAVTRAHQAAPGAREPSNQAPNT